MSTTNHTGRMCQGALSPWGCTWWQSWWACGIWSLYTMGLIMSPSFLAMWISLAPKKYSLRCSRMNWWLAVILFLHSLQMALTASEFICLMMSALHPSVSLQLFSFAFLIQATWSLQRWRVCVHGMRSHCACCPMNQASLEGLHVNGVPVVSECILLYPRHPQRWGLSLLLHLAHLLL